MKAQRKDIMTRARQNKMAVRLLEAEIGKVDEVKQCREHEDGWLIHIINKGKDRLYHVKPVVKTEVKEIKPSLLQRLLG